ncbi:MAG: GHKL domain-containing protein [Bacteroidia bacterium]|nr:GHKL domain-containing protein [Bacteroidia bacterium]
MPYDFTGVFPGNGNVVFYGNKTLYLYSMNLEPVKEIKNITFASGFFDIDHDSKKEFIAFDNNEMVIFSEGFRHKTTFKIEQEFAPFPEKNGISLFKKNGKSCFVFNTRLFYYLFSYNQNRYAFLKYPFFILFFAFWLGLLFLIVRMYSRRLEKENQRLEETIAERTLELERKNRELAAQKTEIQAQAEELSQQNKHLEELDKFKRTLTGTLVHDLKNPLGQIISKSPDKTVNNLVKRMLLLITNLLDVDKYEQTEFKINKELHPLGEIIDEAVGGQEISLQEKNLVIEIQMDDVMVWADKEVLVRVFENLLSNAIRFSPQNQNIKISARYLKNETVKISIKNYGENIPEEVIKSIFDKYMQAHKTGLSNYKTTGLGLTFCKMALEAHEKTIEAENFDGGVIFSFSLDGQIVSSQEIQNTVVPNFTVLSPDEKEMIVPWLGQLKFIEIYQVSDILDIVQQIPDSSENIIAFKQQIADAVFASNSELLAQLTN